MTPRPPSSRRRRSPTSSCTFVPEKSEPPPSPTDEAQADMPDRVTDAINDDNSIIALSNATMDTLQLFRGDTVLVRGKKRKDTVLVVLGDDELDDGSCRLNRVVRHNLRVKHGDVVTIHACPDIKYVSAYPAMCMTTSDTNQSTGQAYRRSAHR